MDICLINKTTTIKPNRWTFCIAFSKQYSSTKKQNKTKKNPNHTPLLFSFFFFFFNQVFFWVTVHCYFMWQMSCLVFFSILFSVSWKRWCYDVLSFQSGLSNICKFWSNHTHTVSVKSSFRGVFVCMCFWTLRSSDMNWQTWANFDFKGPSHSLMCVHDSVFTWFCWGEKLSVFINLSFNGHKNITSNT